MEEEIYDLSGDPRKWSDEEEEEVDHRVIAAGGSNEVAGNQENEEDGAFEQVCLNDQERSGQNGLGNERATSDGLSQISGVSEPSDTSTGKAVADLDDDLAADMISYTVSPKSERFPAKEGKPSLSSASFDSIYSFTSPVVSPSRQRNKPTMPNVSPELLHLVDSAIMGNSGSLEKLQGVVSGKESIGVDGASAESMSRLVVDALLVTMGGIDSVDDVGVNNPPSVMLNSRAAAVAGELIPWLPWEGDTEDLLSPRTYMVKGLLAILKACTRNRSMCSSAGLLGALLWSAEKIFAEEFRSSKTFSWDGSPLCHCIQHLASHSLSVGDLHKWLQVITTIIDTVWAQHLLLALEKAMGGKETKGPACTFEFDGESSGLLGPGESFWPFSNGYGFATWIYIESFADTITTAAAAAAIAAAAAARSGKTSAISAAAAASALAGEGTAHMPRLFSFLSADNQGIEAYFHGQFLVVETGVGRGKRSSLHFTHAFKPQCWYFVGLEHTCRQSLLGRAESELRLYVDGALYETRTFDFPRVSKPLSFCCIGTNPPATMAGLQRRRRQCPLFAEMGPVYIFKEPIGPKRMAHLASRGGDVLPSFGNGAGLPGLSMNDHTRRLAEERVVLDSELSGGLHVLYHPSLLCGRYCPDASPSGAAGTHRRPAEVLGQVHVATRMKPTDSMWALATGGPMSLLPLAVCNVQNDSLQPQRGTISMSVATASFAASIFRIISMASEHPGNNDEIYRNHGPEILSIILQYLLQTLSIPDVSKKMGVSDEELVAAIVSLCQSQKSNHTLKVQLFRNLLLDLKMWNSCNYGLQKKLLSSLADMVFIESSAMRDANAMQMLLDGCRRCFWIIRERDSVDEISFQEGPRLVGEVNALIDELLVVVELLVGVADSSLAPNDMQCLIGFVVDCPQPNQVSRVLHLLYRLIVQPNTSRARSFSDSFISCGGLEALLVLLQRETKTGETYVSGGSSTKVDEDMTNQGPGIEAHGIQDSSSGDVLVQLGESQQYDNSLDRVQDVEQSDSKEELAEFSHHEGDSTLKSDGDDSYILSPQDKKIERRPSVPENVMLRNLGGIGFSISADSARNNVYNIDNSDGIVVGIITLFGALVASGHLKLNTDFGSPKIASHSSIGLPTEGSSMFTDKISLFLFALQKAFEAAPQRLMTSNVYMVLLGASINASSTDDGLNLFDSGHRFEHDQLLLVLLRSLPSASRALQMRAIQDILFLACSHPENRMTLTCMEEWPEWILEVLISNYEMGSSKSSNGATFGDLEDLIHNFLIIVLEHSMRQKDGWKDIEAAIHCAEWLSMVGGSSTGERRVRREESLPIFKRRLLGGLLDFAARELQVQTQVIAAAAAGVAAEGLSPQESKAEAESAAHLSVALAENAIVILMLVEDHLRLQSQLFIASRSEDVPASPLSLSSSIGKRYNHLNSLSKAGPDLLEGNVSRTTSLSNDSGGLSLDVLASMADANGQISAAVMERLTAAAAAEPYESVRCAFVSYGSSAPDLAEGWKYRSRMWYGVGFPSKDPAFGGGGSGWDFWKSSLERDGSGNWIELPLVKKSVTMLQALLLDDCGLGGGLGIGGGSGTGMGGMTALYQLLDSDQPFLCMMRMVLASMREEDTGEDELLMRRLSIKEGVSEGLNLPANSAISLNSTNRFMANLSMRKPRSALLWSVLAPILNMPIAESKRQRVLVACSILYSEVWHAIGRDRIPLRKQFLESIIPPFVAILRRWRPLLAGVHDFTSPDGQNPLVVDDRALSADALPLEAALSMISPGWAAAFASPPTAMALAMIAAGAAGGETVQPRKRTPVRRDSLMIERKTTRLHTFSSFQQSSEIPSKSPSIPRNKAAAQAAALAAARDLERTAKIGSGRGLSAVAMATSAQRRTTSDLERVRRWNVSEAMGIAWTECLQSVDTKSVSVKDLSALSYKYVAVLVGSFALARNIQRVEKDRRLQVGLNDKHRVCTGMQAWRKLICSLVEIERLFAPFGDYLCRPKQIFWKLDSSESSLRMRRCLRRNFKGSSHLGAAANYGDHLMPRKSEQENAIHTAVLAEAISIGNGIEDNELIEPSKDDHTKLDLEISEEDPLQSLTTDKPSAEQSLEIGDNGTFAGHNLADNAAAVTPGYVPSESDERTILELSSLMVQPLQVTPGTLQITTKRINFIADDIIDENSMDGLLETTMSEGRRGGPKPERRDRSWPVSSLHQMFSRRYLLRRSALELFMVDRSNFFFDFGSTEGRKNAYRGIVQARPPHLNNIFLATQRPEQLLKRTQLMERWARWEISNFEYLMQLNTLAGRSYNDITQYPVFPWILSNYSSEDLNLEDPSSYRDLSKPIGALNPERLEKFKERYASFDDPIIPKFHYGSHYSSAGAVLYYLVRVEPFTTLSIQLQGGKFDHADRMFLDIGATWNGVLEDMSDVKELVPELFYLPEVLTNVNSIDFGTTQLGGKLDSVNLPPWANSPVDFIHKHCKALESEFVSAHLNEWIDLIFGYKQRGKEAISANNEFFYITYEGTVDIDKITDPVQQRSTQDQITYFGQTPSQLLTIPHIKRKPLQEILHLHTIFRNPTEVKSYCIPNPERCNVPAAAIFASSDSVVVVDESAPAAHVALHNWQPNTPDGHGTPFLFQHGKVIASSGGGAFLRMFKGSTGSGSEDWHFPRALAFATSGIRSSAVIAITSDKEIITGGHADNSVKVVTSDGAKTIETSAGHCAPVTCIALSSDSNYLVTGSRDTTVVLWKIHRAKPTHLRNLSDPSPTLSSASNSGSSGNFSSIGDLSRSRRMEGPMHVLRGHLREVACCCVSSEVGVVASSSALSGVLLHSIRRGRLIRKLASVEAHSLCLSPRGVLLTWNQSEKKFRTFTVHGVPIMTVNLSAFPGIISCIEVSADGENVLVGTSSCPTIESSEKQMALDAENNPGFICGSHDENQMSIPVPSICFMDLHTLKVFHSIPLSEGQDITALALNKDNTNLLVSTADKQLIVFTDPSLSLKVVDQMLRLGWEGEGLSPLMK